MNLEQYIVNIDASRNHDGKHTKKPEEGELQCDVITNVLHCACQGTDRKWKSPQVEFRREGRAGSTHNGGRVRNHKFLPSYYVFHI